MTGIEIYQHGFDVVRCAVFDCTHRAGKGNKQKSYDNLADFYMPGAPSHNSSTNMNGNDSNKTCMYMIFVIFGQNLAIYTIFLQGIRF